MAFGAFVNGGRRGGGGGLKGESSVLFLLRLFLCLALFVATATANVVLIGNNASLSFDDIEANFAPSVRGPGECGILYLAEPLDACLPLKNEVIPTEGGISPFVLIARGGCTFEEKVRRAQSAGFKAAIIYDNEDDDSLVASNVSPLVSFTNSLFAYVFMKTNVVVLYLAILEM